MPPRPSFRKRISGSSIGSVPHHKFPEIRRSEWRVMKKMLPLLMAVASMHGLEAGRGASLADLKGMIARFAPTELRVDTSALSAGDRRTLARLIEASQIVNDIFLTQLWSGNHALLQSLEKDQ